MPKQDPDDEFEKKQVQYHQAAINALQSFVSKYSPATINDFDTLFTTNEISQAIAQHTGVTLYAPEIAELMTQMNYTYDTMNGLEFNWLLKKEVVLTD